MIKCTSLLNFNFFAAEDIGESFLQHCKTLFRYLVNHKGQKQCTVAFSIKLFEVSAITQQLAV